MVVDDAAQGVTEVIRGDDLIPSTPRQLLLYEGGSSWQAPRFSHVPLVVGTDGRLVAKRHGDTRCPPCVLLGVPPERLLGLLAWSCGWLGRASRSMTARELLPLFHIESIPNEPFVLTPELLGSIGYR